MLEIRKAKLSTSERLTLLEAAKVMDRLDKEFPSDVMFDSNDQYYVACSHVAEAFRELAQS